MKVRDAETSIENQRELHSRLRFPEFENASAWASKPMGEIYSFIGTNSLSRDKLNYQFGEARNIHYGDIHTKFSTHFQVQHERVPFINPAEALRTDPNDYCVEGDMVFADASEDLQDVGKSIEVISLNGERVLSGQHTIMARPTMGVLVLGFGGYLFQSATVRAQIKKEAQGAKVLGISPRKLAKVNLYYPLEKTEQQKVVNCLSSLDELIAAESRKLNALRHHKKGLLQQLFPAEGETIPSLRFPEFQNAEDWQAVEVGEIFRVTRGEVLSMTLVVEKRTANKPYPVYSSQTKKRGLAGFYSDYLYENAITWTTDGANAGDVNYRAGRFYCTNVCGVLISDKGYANPCVAALINSVAKGHVSYVGNPKLMNGVMARIAISVPSLQEQQRIADLLSSVDKLITSQERRVDTLKAHKKGLMQQLFPALDEVQV